MKRLGIQSVRKGPVSLRHACATELLKNDMSLQEIADFLVIVTVYCWGSTPNRFSMHSKELRQSIYARGMRLSTAIRKYVQWRRFVDVHFIRVKKFYLSFEARRRHQFGPV